MVDSPDEGAASPAEVSGGGGYLFEARPTEFIVRAAFVMGALPLALAGAAGVPAPASAPRQLHDPVLTTD